MSRLTKQAQAAIASVARRFAATWEEGEGGSPDAYLTIAGTRIAVEFAAIESGSAEHGGLATPRLRFDKGALRVVGRLRAALSEVVADGEAVVLTITAPIRLPAKTAAALESKIRDHLARASASTEIKETIHGNQVRVRLVEGVSRRMPKVVGYVHNPDSDPELLLQLTSSWLRRVGAAADKRPPPDFIGDRWLVIADQAGLPPIQTYRLVHSQLAGATDFKSVLVVLAGERVESASEGR